MKDILVVEDGRDERERLASILGNEGYTVVSCESVAEAETALEETDFRLAILDIGLGDKSGSYLFHSIRQRLPDSQVIIYTGNPSIHLKERFLDEGATDYIVKGSSMAEERNFLGRVKELLGAAKGREPEELDLGMFLERYVASTSKNLFLDMNDRLPPCGSCGSVEYIVTFSEEAQLPPKIQGKVLCKSCRAPMDPEVV